MHDNGSTSGTELGPTPPLAQPRLQIGVWSVDPAVDEISCNGEVIKLEPRSMRILLYLAANAGRVIGLRELLDEIWPNVLVTPQSVYNAVAQLRRTLGDSAEVPRYIATVARKGYRLVAVVQPLAAEQVSLDRTVPAVEVPASVLPPSVTIGDLSPRTHGLRWGVIVGALLVVASFLYVGIRDRLWGPGSPSVAGPSVAVLPLVDLSQAHDQAYLSDGLAEELTNLLAQVPGLKVASRTSAFVFRGQTDDVASIAARLRVSHVLEGSVRTSGSTLRVTLQLIQTDNGFHVWSKTYDRGRAELFRLEDDVAAEVVRALRGPLMATQAAPRPAPNSEAYMLLLEGRYYGRRGSQADRAQSVALYESAVAVDPTYALAWAWLAQGYGVQAAAGWVPGDTGYDRARRSAQRAITLNPNLADAHTALGYVLESYDWDWKGADAEYRRALALDPTNVRALNLNAHLAVTLGRLSDAERYYRLAIERDPQSPGASTGLVITLLREDRLADGEEAARRALSLAPTSTRISMVEIALRKGRPDDALALIEAEPAGRWRNSALPIVYDALGRHADADRALVDLIKEYAQFPYRIAVVYAARGRTDAAFEWLERARQVRDFDLIWIATDPWMNPLRGDPRFGKLLRGMALAP